MRHAVLGAGAVGGLLSAALARAGVEVVVLMRPESLSGYRGRFLVSSHVLGDFEVEVPAVSALDRDVDVLWVTTKTTQLTAALTLAPPELVRGALVIPLMNGVDHMTVLRTRYAAVAAATLRVASERVGEGRISQTSPFIRVDLVGPESVARDVRAAGIECVIGGDELTLLWQKLAFLAPLALATTVADGPLGTVRQDETYLRAQQEVLAVAEAEGARVDVVALEALRSAAPDTMRSSMQHDVELGRTPEIDAIAGPILRGGQQHGIDTAATQMLAELVRARAGLAPSQLT